MYSVTRSWSEIIVVVSSTYVAGLVCCSRLIRTLITACSAGFHLLLLVFGIPGLRPHLIHWSLKYQVVERPNLPGDLHRFEYGMTFSTLYLIPESWIGSRVQWTVGCFPEFYFLQFSVVLLLVGFQKHFINNFTFPTWGCAAGFNNNNNNSLVIHPLLREVATPGVEYRPQLELGLRDLFFSCSLYLFAITLVSACLLPALCLLLIFLFLSASVREKLEHEFHFAYGHTRYETSFPRDKKIVLV